jgi:hypothetical protein
MVLLLVTRSSSALGVCCINPLSAKARTPSRPSGAAKKKQTAENEGGSRRRQAARPGHRAKINARRHAKTLNSTAKVAEKNEFRLNLGPTATF